MIGNAFRTFPLVGAPPRAEVPVATAGLVTVAWFEDASPRSAWTMAPEMTAAIRMTTTVNASFPMKGRTASARAERPRGPRHLVIRVDRAIRCEAYRRRSGPWWHGGTCRSQRAPGRIRTSDQRIRSPSLYPLSYGRYQEFRARAREFDGQSDGLSLFIALIRHSRLGSERTPADRQWRCGEASDGLFVRWSASEHVRMVADAQRRVWILDYVPIAAVEGHPSWFGNRGRGMMCAAMAARSATAITPDLDDRIDAAARVFVESAKFVPGLSVGEDGRARSWWWPLPTAGDGELIASLCTGASVGAQRDAASRLAAAVDSLVRGRLVDARASLVTRRPGRRTVPEAWLHSLTAVIRGSPIRRCREVACARARGRRLGCIGCGDDGPSSALPARARARRCGRRLDGRASRAGSRRSEPARVGGAGVGRQRAARAHAIEEMLARARPHGAGSRRSSRRCSTSPNPSRRRSPASGVVALVHDRASRRSPMRASACCCRRGGRRSAGWACAQRLRLGGVDPARRSRAAWAWTRWSRSSGRPRSATGPITRAELRQLEAAAEAKQCARADPRRVGRAAPRGSRGGPHHARTGVERRPWPRSCAPGSVSTISTCPTTWRSRVSTRRAGLRALLDDALHATVDAGTDAGRLRRHAAPVSGARRRLARVPRPARPRRVSRRRHGARQDRAAHRRAHRRPASRADARRVSRVGARQLAARARPVRPGHVGARPPRPRSVHRATACRSPKRCRTRRRRADDLLARRARRRTARQRCRGRGCALDEAQQVKNPAPRRPAPCGASRHRRRVALTGTPVENRLSELWSIMHVLNPGLLGSCAIVPRARSPSRSSVTTTRTATERLRRDHRAVRAPPTEDRQERSSTTSPTRSRRPSAAR